MVINSVGHGLTRNVTKGSAQRSSIKAHIKWKLTSLLADVQLK